MKDSTNQPLFDSSQMMRKKNLALFLLILTTLLWGTSFIITRTLTNTIPVFFYLGLRYSIATIGLIPIFRRYKGLSMKEVKIAGIAGLIYFFSIVTQTIGMRFTTASKAGFLTGLNVILVPIIVAIVFKKSISKKLWVAVILATIGTYIMSFTGLELVTIGDPLVIICALLYAIYIIYIDRKAKDIDIYRFSQLQLLFITIASFGISAIIEDWHSIFTMKASMIFTLDHFLWLIYIGIAVTSLTFIFQVYGQRYINETKTSLIFSLEPIFATVFAVLWGNEFLSVQLYIGSILIFIGILIPSIKRNNKRDVKNDFP